MSETTIQALKRLTFLPERPDNINGDLIGGQNYWDIWFTGGFMSNITLTDVTINGVSTARTERIITDPGNVTVAADDYVITVKKTVPQITSVILPASPAQSRSIIVKDGAFNAGSFNITVDGNGKNIDQGATYVISISGGSVELIYNGTEWNIIGSYKDTSSGGGIVAPNTTTNRAVVLWDGTNGTAVQNSGVIIDASNNITAHNLTGTNTGDQTITLTGAVTGSGTGSFATSFASAGIASIAGLSVTADKILFTTATNTWSSASLSPFSRGLLPNVDTAAWQSSLSLTPGTNIQAFDAGLQSISGLTTAANKGIYTTASDTYATYDLTSQARQLLDDTSFSSMRTTLGLGSAAQFNVGTAATNVVQLNGSAQLPALDGSLLTGILIKVDSSEIVYANGSRSYNFSHGLGDIPRLCQVRLRCKIAEYNYAVDDEIIPSINGSTTNFINVVANATSVSAIQVGNFPMINASTLAQVTPTAANWRIVFYVFR